MTDPQHYIRAWMQRELDRMGHGAKGKLADFLKVRPDAITRMANTDPGKEKREIRGHELIKMEAFFGSKPDEASDHEPEHMVRIMGLAGAGPDGAVLFATGDGDFGEIPAPIDSSAAVEALEVRGDSMYGIANDGWILFYDEKETPAPQHMGELCVCYLEDDRVLVKIPYPGSAPGLFNLESANAKPMRDIPVRYVSIVTDIKTRSAARKFIRRNPDHPILDLKIG